MVDLLIFVAVENPQLKPLLSVIAVCVLGAISAHSLSESGYPRWPAYVATAVLLLALAASHLVDTDKGLRDWGSTVVPANFGVL